MAATHFRNINGIFPVTFFLVGNFDIKQRKNMAYWMGILILTQHCQWTELKEIKLFFFGVPVQHECVELGENISLTLLINYRYKLQLCDLKRNLSRVERYRTTNIYFLTTFLLLYTLCYMLFCIEYSRLACKMSVFQLAMVYVD